MSQPSCICLINDVERYCVKTKIRVIPELTQLLSVKSISRNLPAKGTAGFVRCLVKGSNLSPAPPAIISVSSLSTIVILRYTPCGYYTRPGGKDKRPRSHRPLDAEENGQIRPCILKRRVPRGILRL